MRKDKLAILLAFLAAVAVGVAIKMLPSNNNASATNAVAPPPPRLDPSKVGEFRGFALQLHNADANHPYEEYLDEIAATGANTVMLVVKAFQENCKATSVFIDLRKTPSDEHLKRLVSHAHRKGLRVVLMPIVLLENPRDGEWRGKIAPDNWDDWWEDYTAYIVHYAKIAQASGVEVFMVGSELVSTERDTRRWRKVIAEVRQVYGNLLSYSANWDHYDVIEFWKDLDIVGMTTYYDLSGGKEPTLPTLLEAWKPIKNEILAWRENVGRPIMFTEVGWPNQVTCAQFPWDYYRSPDKPDPKAQSNCFESFFQTWAHERVVAGMLVWEWRNYPQQKTGPKDTSYVPCGKPCMDVIRKYFTAPTAWDRDHKGPTTHPAPQADPLVELPLRLEDTSLE